jgi:hypothetical protein
VPKRQPWPPPGRRQAGCPSSPPRWACPLQQSFPQGFDRARCAALTEVAAPEADAFTSADMPASCARRRWAWGAGRRGRQR